MFFDRDMLANSRSIFHRRACDVCDMIVFSPTKRGVEPKRVHANSLGDTEMDGSESGIIHILYQPIDEDKIATFFRCIKQ